MSSNEKKMTLEEKLVQNIKSDTVLALVGDEDALHELVKRAIHEALFQPQRVKDSYYNYKEKDSIVVETARDVARKLAEEAMPKIIGELLKNEEVKKTLNVAIAAALADAVVNGVDHGLNSQIKNTAFETSNDLRIAILNAGINIPT